MTNFALFILRLAPGVIFFIHGLSKLFLTYAQSIDFFATLGFPAANFFSIGIGLLELIGGIALLAGVGTRLFAALFATEMLVATIVAELPHGFNSPGAQLTITLFAVALALAFLGEGGWSLKNLLNRRKAPLV